MHIAADRKYVRRSCRSLTVLVVNIPACKMGTARLLRRPPSRSTRPIAGQLTATTPTGRGLHDQDPGSMTQGIHIDHFRVHHLEGSRHVQRRSSGNTRKSGISTHNQKSPSSTTHNSKIGTCRPGITFCTLWASRCLRRPRYPLGNGRQVNLERIKRRQQPSCPQKMLVERVTSNLLNTTAIYLGFFVSKLVKMKVD